MAEYREYFHCLRKFVVSHPMQGKVREILFFVPWRKKEDFLKALAAWLSAGNFAVKIPRHGSHEAGFGNTVVGTCRMEGGWQTAEAFSESFAL